MKTSESSHRSRLLGLALRAIPGLARLEVRPRRVAPATRPSLRVYPSPGSDPTDEYPLPIGTPSASDIAVWKGMWNEAVGDKRGPGSKHTVIRLNKIRSSKKSHEVARMKSKPMRTLYITDNFGAYFNDLRYAKSRSCSSENLGNRSQK